MNLLGIKRQYEEGIICKKEFIDRMHERHCVLFEYADYLQRFNTGIQKIEIADGQVIITTNPNDIKMICDPFDKRIVPIEMLNFGPYEEDVYKIIGKLIGSDSVIFDIGANYGWYSLIFSKIFPNARVFAFEPIPSTFNYFLTNISLNHCQNVKAFNHGLSNESGTINFYFYPELSANASITNVSGREDVQIIPCQVKRLDEFVLENKVYPDFIKCDVEGAELLVFQGGYETIKKYKPIIFTEMLRKWAAKFNYHPNQIISFLKDLGYRCFILHNNGELKEFLKMDENTIETNFFFLNKEKHIKQFQNLQI
jgi:FkbM family methyltransferase